MQLHFKFSFPVAAVLCCLYACKHPPQIIPKAAEDNFPADVSRILVTKCAVAGCHNKASYESSGGGLLMDTWEHLFNGGNTGAAIVPYSPESSGLLYFINSFPDLGDLPPADMKMPLNNPSLSREEYHTLRNWIIQGCPDKNGNIPFASHAAERQKIYVAHQGCDYVTVIDAEKNVVMRCLPVGKEVIIESAYSLKIAPDGNAYLSYFANQYILKLSTLTDSLADEIDLGSPNSTIIHALPNGNEILVSNLFTNSLLRVNTANKQIINDYGSGGFTSPHGIAANKTSDTFFVTEQFGNIVYKIAASGTVKKISIDGNPYTTNSNAPNPYNIQMTPDHSKYFLTCPGSNELRVMDAYADTLIAVIPVGTTPQEMAISKTMPYLFLSCMDDAATIPLYKGSVYIIDYHTLQVVKKINDRYYMPHALTVDDIHQKLFVFSRNIDPTGPVPHHNSAVCTGRNGYYSVYDFNAMQPVDNKRYEVTIDPFAADVRFK